MTNVLESLTTKPPMSHAERDTLPYLGPKSWKEFNHHVFHRVAWRFLVDSVERFFWQLRQPALPLWTRQVLEDSSTICKSTHMLKVQLWLLGHLRVRRPFYGTPSSMWEVFVSWSNPLLIHLHIAHLLYKTLTLISSASGKNWWNTIMDNHAQMAFDGPGTVQL